MIFIPIITFQHAEGRQVVLVAHQQQQDLLVLQVNYLIRDIVSTQAAKYVVERLQVVLVLDFLDFLEHLL